MLTQNHTKCIGSVFHALLTRHARLSWLMDYEVCPFVCVYDSIIIIMSVCVLPGQSIYIVALLQQYTVYRAECLFYLTALIQQ